MRKAGYLLILLVVMFAPALMAESPETYSATAMIVPASGPAVSSFATIRITRWTTDVERTQLEQVLMKEGSRKLADALHDQPETGTIRVGSGKPFLLHYARKTQVEGGTRIVVATDRPISTKELRWADPSTQYDIAVAVIDMGADGKGQGTLSAATKVKYDVSNQLLELETYAYDPVKLLNVKLSR